MTRDETKKLLLLMESTYPNFTIQDSIMVDAWWVQLKADDYKTMETALVIYNRTNTSGFAPSIGQLVDVAYRTSSAEMTEMEAWGLVRSRLGSSTYHSQENWESLPEEVRRAVTPNQLRAWAMDSQFNEGVAQSNFCRAYRTALEQKKNTVKLPEYLREQIAMTSQRLIGEKNGNNQRKDTADVPRWCVS